LFNMPACFLSLDTLCQITSKLTRESAADALKL